MPTKPRVSAHSSIEDKHLEGKYLFKYESTKEVAQQVKALTAKPGDPSSISGTPWWKGRANSHTLSSDFHLHAMARTHSCPNTQK